MHFFLIIFPKQKAKHVVVEFIISVKSTIFWLHRGVMLSYEFDVPDLWKKYLKYTASNLYWGKKWCVLLQQQSHRPHFKFSTILFVQLSWRVASPYNTRKRHTWIKSIRRKHQLELKYKNEKVWVRLYKSQHCIAIKKFDRKILENKIRQNISKKLQKNTQKWENGDKLCILRSKT